MSNSGSQPGLLSRFFTFRAMISPVLIKIMYVLGTLGLLVGGVTMIVAKSSDKDIFIGAAMIIGVLPWRIICELWILFFSIHEVLVSVERGKKNPSV